MFWQSNCQKGADPIFPVETSLALVTLSKCIINGLYLRDDQKPYYVEMPNLEWEYKFGKFIQQKPTLG